MNKKAIADIPESEKPAGMSDEEFVKLQVRQLISPWMLTFLKHDPAPVLEKVNCPVLAINGEKGLQVPPTVNLDAIKRALENTE